MGNEYSESVIGLDVVKIPKVIFHKRAWSIAPYPEVGSCVGGESSHHWGSCCGRAHKEILMVQPEIFSNHVRADTALRFCQSLKDFLITTVPQPA